MKKQTIQKQTICVRNKDAVFEGEYVTLPSVDDKIEQLKAELYILRVKGDSMVNAGIKDGDCVLVQEKKEFYSGEIVLAYIGEKATIKRFMSIDEPPYLYLQPENSKYEQIFFTDDVCLSGKIISVLKGDKMDAN